jgi:hypothetical protein
MDEISCRTIYREVLLGFVCRRSHGSGCTALSVLGQFAAVEGVSNYRFSFILARRQMPYVVVWVRAVTYKYRQDQEIARIAEAHVVHLTHCQTR